jgi:hypothetical protein
MKKLVVVTTLCLFAAIVASNVFGAEANEPTPPPKEHHRVTVEGTVSAVKDATGALTAVTLQVSDTIKYNITLDDKGKELGALDGKKVRVIGTVKTEGQVEWLTVHRFEEIAATPPPTPPPAPK